MCGKVYFLTEASAEGAYAEGCMWVNCAKINWTWRLNNTASLMHS